MDAQQQATAIKAVLDGPGAKLTAGSDWYVLSMRWWDLWKDYTLFGQSSADTEKQPDLVRQRSGPTKGQEPPEIDNSDLLSRPGCDRLQGGLAEHRDFVLLPQEAWQLLHTWYGGGPALKRKVIAQGGGGSAELRVELYPLWLSVYRVDSGGFPDEDSKLEVMFSRSETLGHVTRDLGTNLNIAGASIENVHLWHRASVEEDQTSIDALEGWEQLQPEEGVLEDLGVVDGASILLEQVIVTKGLYDTQEKWPFFHRMRVDFKKRNFKNPSDVGVVLEVDDQIDASVVEMKTKFDSISRSWEPKNDTVWYAATVVERTDEQVLVQFHNRAKPQTKGVSADALVVLKELAGDLVVGNQYEAKDSKDTWHQVRIAKKNESSPAAYVAELLDEATTWPAVLPQFVREQTQLTEGCLEALKKIFDRYASEGMIQSGGLRGLISCATNDFVPEDSKEISAFLKEPFGNGEGIELDGFLEYWRQKVAASSGSAFFIQQQLGRLFNRVGIDMGSEADKLLAQGKEWIQAGSSRLAQFRSHTEPGYSDSRDLRDFRRFQNLDVLLGDEWKQASVKEVNWTEMSILVQTKEQNSVTSSKVQREWIPMESDRLAEFETKSLEAPEHELDPGPLLARSFSRGGLCVKPGACGLQNLGNTCFMNSILQCLSNSIELRSFFAGSPGEAPAFLDQISTSPLSTEGKLAREFSRFLRLLWSNEKKVVAPAALKKLIGTKRPEFSGYQQHDAQELLTFLLDGLHEDVNRAPHPPPSGEDIPEEPRLADEDLSARMWDNHVRLNNSQILDLFHFQLRSELQCPVTSNISVTFDPIMYLTLIVPKPPPSVLLTVVPASFPDTPLQVVSLEVPNTATFEELEVALWAHLGRTPSEAAPTFFSFADVISDRIYKHFEKTHLTGEIRPNDNVYAFEVKLSQGVPYSKHRFVSVSFRKRVTPTWKSSAKWQYDRFMTPKVLAVPEGTTNSQVHAQLQAMANVTFELGKVERPWLVSFQSCATAWGDGQDHPDDDRVFEMAANLFVDFLEEKQANTIKDALPKLEQTKITKAGGTTLEDCLVKSMEKEVLSEADSVYCRKCKEFRCQSKKLDIWSAPQLLIVHLKRFGRERLDGPLVKISCPVEFSATLDLAPYMRREVDGGANYELYGVVNHIGNVGAGHYTADAVVTPPGAVDQASGEWFNFNDSIVSKTSPSSLNPESAYILFYRRKL